MASTPAPLEDRHATLAPPGAPAHGVSNSFVRVSRLPVAQASDPCTCWAPTSTWHSACPSVLDGALARKLEGGGNAYAQVPLVVTQQTRVVLAPRQNPNPDTFSALSPSPDVPVQTTLFAYLPRDAPTTIFIATSIPSLSSAVIFYSSFTSTLPNGSVAVVLTTVPTGMLPTTTSQATPTQGSVNTALGPLLGGLLGGFFGLLLTGMLLWCAWRRRHNICGNDQQIASTPTYPEVNLKFHDRSSRYSSQFSGYRSPGRSTTPAPEPLPYQYGALGRPKSVDSTRSSRGPQSPTHSPSQSHSRHLSTTPPPSAYLYNSTTGAPPGIATALTPGSSMASSSRSSTPGLGYPPSLHQYQQERQQRQGQSGRVSWPRSGGEEGQDVRLSPKAKSERRPSRLSLTLANWNPETDGNFVVQEEERDEEVVDAVKKEVVVQEEKGEGGGVEVEVMQLQETGDSSDTSGITSSQVAACVAAPF